MTWANLHGVDRHAPSLPDSGLSSRPCPCLDRPAGCQRVLARRRALVERWHRLAVADELAVLDHLAAVERGFDLDMAIGLGAPDEADRHAVARAAGGDLAGA